MIQIDSSLIKEISWTGEEPGTKSMLTIRFTSDSVYYYYDVPREVYEGLFNAPSAGQYFHSNIKDKYVFEKAGS